MDVNEELKFLEKLTKKKLGGGSGEGVRWGVGLVEGVRVDVNEELKFIASNTCTFRDIAFAMSKI